MLQVSAVVVEHTPAHYLQTWPACWTLPCTLLTVVKPPTSRPVPVQVGYEKRREEFVRKEQARWQHMDEEARREADRIQQVRQAGNGGRQTKSSEHFDIISLKYHQTKEGQVLQYKVRRQYMCVANRL